MNATEPALFVTLICDRLPEGTQVITHLARPEGEGGLALIQHRTNEWRNTSEQTWVRRFNHPEMKDVELLQLALNPDGDAAEGFLRASERLKLALKELPEAPVAALEAVVGRTLVYQAILPEEADPETVMQALLAKKSLRATNGHLVSRTLAVSDVPGGRLWLLATPLGRAQETIYFALGPEKEQKRLNLDVLFGPRAALLWPDTVAHKAYSMAHQYLSRGARARLRQATDALMTQTTAILQAEDASEPNELDQLSEQVANLTTVMAELRRLHSRLEVHRFNYERSLEESALRGPVTDYHHQQMDNILFRVNQDLVETTAALEAANTATGTLRAKYQRLQAEYERQQAEEERKQTQIEKEDAERKANADFFTNAILAVLTTALTVGQIVDPNQELMLFRLPWILGTAAGTALIFFLIWFKRHRE